MQKKIIALAVAGLASTAAFAQTNVTVYGVADASFEVASANNAVGPADLGSFTRVNTNSSLIGFKGTEDLGNGLKALFQFESAVNFDTAGGALSGGRDSYVGLNGGFGTVQMGKLTGPTRLLGAMVDLNAGATGPGANSSIIGKPVAGAGAGTFDTRFSNTIAYVSPVIAGGLTLVGAYVSGENKSLDNAAAAAIINTRGYDFGALYGNGPVFVGLTYGKVNNNLSNIAAGSNLDSQQIVRLAGSYTLTGGHKFTALVERNKNEYNGIATFNASELKRNVWGLGAKVMVTANGGLIAQYYRANAPKGDFYADNSNRGASLYELGYEHSLSKRTMLKASFTQLNNKANAAYDFNVGVVGGGFGVGANPQVLAAGIRHTF